MTKLSSAPRLDARPTQAQTAPTLRPGRGPITALLDLFSNVRFGIVILSALFVYSWLGSAGVWYPIHPNIFHPDAWVHAQIRQFRGLELTEFDWFHWWPFDVIIALLCTNMAITTVRRIPLRVVNLGVWMIHTGIITLALGSVLYFSTKVEGDAPILRRAVLIEAPGHAPVRIPTLPGAVATIGEGDGQWSFEVGNTDPDWEIRSGNDGGKIAYSVNVVVRPPGKSPFMRQLLAGYPQHTEDVIQTGDPAQPLMRAKKLQGEDRPLVDESLRMTLELEPQPYFFLVHERALYLRERGTSEWIERPIASLPRYNDYIRSADDVWNAGDVPIDPVDVRVAAVDDRDPLPGVDLRVSGYLRYALMQERPVTGGDVLNPALSARLISSEGREFTYRLMALDPRAAIAEGGLVAFRWADSAEEVAELQKPPRLIVSVEGGSVTDLEIPIASPTNPESPCEYKTIPGTSYQYCVRELTENLPLADGMTHRLAIVSIRTPQREFTRWAAEESELTRDLAEGDTATGHGDAVLLDTNLRMEYRPGRGKAKLLFVGGPEETDLAAIVAVSETESRLDRFPVGTAVAFDADLSYQVTGYSPRVRMERRPQIVPLAQRDRDLDAESFHTLVRVEGQGLTPVASTAWLQFHKYPFADENQTLLRYPFNPSVFRTADGREIEVLFSRQREPLPAPAALEEFRLTSHVGGYTGEQSTIRDYTSFVRFMTPEGPTSAQSVSMNAPIYHGGFAFYQAFWDPPIPPRGLSDMGSKGMNYTVLGVGNRQGVWVQLSGCIIAVIGMIYAFYVKPAIKRRRRQAVLASMGARQGAPT
jgi:hypothetical protein